MAKKVDLGFTLLPWQQAVYDHPANMKLVRAGRQSGKSKLGLKWILEGAFKPGTYNGIVAPTALQGKDIFWNDIINALQPVGLIRSKNATRGDITLTIDSHICIRGTNVEDNLRGFKWHKLLLDEYAYHKALVWEKILRPQLLAYNGNALFTSTPRGQNHFKRMDEYLAKQSVLFPKDYATFHHTIYENTHLGARTVKGKEVLLTPEELIAHIEKEKSGHSEEVWRQEYLAEYIDWIGIVYHECDPEKHIFSPTEKHSDYRNYPYIRALDWGLGDNTACMWLHTKDKKILIADEYVKNNVNPATHCKYIESLGVGRGTTNYNVIDKTAFKRESSGKSVAQQFSEMGIRPLCPSSGGVDYGTNIVKRLFTNNQILISTHCQKTIQALLEWEHGNHEPDCLAAMRYGVVYAVEKGLIEINDNKGLEKVRSGQVFTHPNNIGKIIRPSVYQDESWNYEDGCAE